MDVRTRASHYLAKMEPGISGQGGHDATFAAAVALVTGFDLTEAEAMELLRAEYNPRCQPQWTDKELLHKVQSASAGGSNAPPAGYLLGENQQRRGAKHNTTPPPEPPPRDWRAAAVAELPPNTDDWPPSWREEFEERAAIMEVDGGLDRTEARGRAAASVQARYVGRT